MTKRRTSSIFVMAGGGMQSLIVGLQSIILIPIYVRQVGERLYGAWLGSGDVLSWMLVSDLGITNLVIQKVAAAHGAGDERDVGRWFASGTAVVAAICAILCAVGIGASFAFPRIFGLQGAEADALRRTFVLATVSTSVVILHTAFYGYARGVQRTGLLSATTVVSTLLQFAISLVLALRGFGLLAIGYGFVARAVVQVIGMAIFFAREVPAGVRANLRVDREVLRELGRTVPATAVAGFAFAAMNQSELLIVSLLVGPAAAAVFMLNRKAIELARALSDSVTFGTYGAYAHLVASADRGRALNVYREILSVRTALAVLMAAGYVALNRSFVSVWVGPEKYVGLTLTALFAVQSIMAGNAFLANYLYRAAGFIVEGSMLLLAESVLRVGLMVGLCLWLGLPGVPLAGIASGAVFLLVTHRKLRAFCLGFQAADRPISPAFWGVCAGLLAACVALGAGYMSRHWLYVFGAGSGILALGAVALAPTNAYLARYRAAVASRLPMLRGAAAP
ncbi:MAG TPA: oligosaccharide flippase family protein [Longimicrobiaceae bacterium]|jgi:O-antigen/teichoic acid export membrane protein|nr:oligosaccharide flippase family protein [Longimicrobiaceae bacterium]